MGLDLSIFFTGYNNVVAIKNERELEELASYLKKHGHKAIWTEAYRSEAIRGNLAFRLFEDETPGRLTWTWAELSYYENTGMHNVFVLDDLRWRVADFGEIPSGTSCIDELFLS